MVSKASVYYKCFLLNFFIFIPKPIKNAVSRLVSVFALDKSLYNLQQGLRFLQSCAQKCTLLGEISIETNMYYDSGNNYIVGLEDFDNKQTSCHETNSISSGFDDWKAYQQVEASS